MPELTRAQGDAIQRARAQLHHGFASMWPDDALACSRRSTVAGW